VTFSPLQTLADGSTETNLETRAYDIFGRLTSETSSGVTATYAYQADSLRLSKTVGGVKTTHVWDGGQMVAELNASNAVTARYIRGAGGRIVSSLDASGAARYYMYNGHGDVAGLTDASGALAKTYRYDAFGGEANPVPTDPNPFRYAGEYFDGETGDYYLRARYYDPSMGRFASEDPIRNGYNWYVYASNNPVNFIDSSGLASVAIRDYTNGYGGAVNWDDTWGVASFDISGITLWATGSGYNDHGITITNIDGRLYAEDYELDDFFGQALTWGRQEGNARNIAGVGLAIADGVAMADSPLPGPADVAGAAIAAGTVVVAVGVAIYELDTAQSGKYGDKTVKDVLKQRKGSIKQAPLPPGSPGWDTLLPLTMEAIRKAADKGEAGMKTIWKLLNDSRFYK
jgi:RHS repeat-associated protein